jgi:hypothetical protein
VRRARRRGGREEEEEEDGVVKGDRERCRVSLRARAFASDDDDDDAFCFRQFSSIVSGRSRVCECSRSENLRPSRRFRHCGNSSRVHVTRRRPGGTAGRAAERFGRSVTRLRTPGASRRSRRPRWMPVTATRAVLRDLAGLRTRLGLLASAPSRQNSGRLACRAASSRAFVAERGGRHAHALARPSVSARVARGTPVALPRRHTGASAPPPDRLRPANWCLPLATKPESRTRLF